MYRWTDPAPRAVAAIRQRRHLRRVREWQPRGALNSQNPYNNNQQFSPLSSLLPPGAFGCPV